MHELIRIDENGYITARELYEFLELDPKNYSRWAKSNIEENQFAEEGIDYFPFVMNEEWGGRATTNYNLTIPFAKKLCMLSKSERGEQARNYFIEVEKRYIQQTQTLPQMSQLEIVAAIAQAAAAQEKAIAQIAATQTEQAGRIAQLENKVSKRFTDDHNLQVVTPTQLGMMFEPQLSGQAVNKRLQQAGLQWKCGGDWVSTVEGKKYSTAEPLQLDNGKITYRLYWQRRVKELIG